MAAKQSMYPEQRLKVVAMTRGQTMPRLLRRSERIRRSYALFENRPIAETGVFFFAEPHYFPCPDVISSKKLTRHIFRKNGGFNLCSECVD